MRNMPILHNHDPSKVIGRYDPETSEVEFMDGIEMPEGGLSLYPGYEIVEAEERNGVRMVKRLKVYEMSVGLLDTH